MNLSGASAYDTVFPGALLRVTFVKAHFFQSADTFYEQSQIVYDSLAGIANVYHADAFPLVSGDTKWTVDVRTQQERQLADIANAIQSACDVTGVDVVAVDKIEVLSPDKVQHSNSDAGKAERAMADADASQRAASNPVDAISSAFSKLGDALGNVGKWVVIVLVIILLIYFFSRRK